MLLTKTFKYRIYPTKEQQILLAKHFGAKRFVYNHFLNERKTLYLSNKTTLNYYDNAKTLTSLKKEENYTWMKEINSQTLQASLRDLDVAYNKFFHKQSKFPRFKSKHDKQSFRIPQFVVYKTGKLWIPKFKEHIEVKEDRPLTGKILFATISKRPSGKYYVAITVETEHIPYPTTDKKIGIDLGVKDFVICSDGKVHPNIKTTKKYEKRLTYDQRQLSKKVKGSKNRGKQQVRVAKVHERIFNIRHDYLHQISSQIVRENQTICVESLTVKNMMKNHCLAKAIADVAWGEFIRQLKYKSEWNGRNLVQINRFFPSSKMCNKCKHINQNLTLDDRVWTCSKCECEVDRDVNAAINILEQGLMIYSGSGIESELKQKREEASISKLESMSHETQSSLAVG
mgnify:CR=1 FL=1